MINRYTFIFSCIARDRLDDDATPRVASRHTGVKPTSIIRRLFNLLLVDSRARALSLVLTRSANVDSIHQHQQQLLRLDDDVANDPPLPDVPTTGISRTRCFVHFVWQSPDDVLRVVVLSERDDALFAQVPPLPTGSSLSTLAIRLDFSTNSRRLLVFECERAAFIDRCSERGAAIAADAQRHAAAPAARRRHVSLSKTTIFAPFSSTTTTSTMTVRRRRCRRIASSISTTTRCSSSRRCPHARTGIRQRNISRCCLASSLASTLACHGLCRNAAISMRRRRLCR
jgi:hypothetical protein